MKSRRGTQVSGQVKDQARRALFLAHGSVPALGDQVPYATVKVSKVTPWTTCGTALLTRLQGPLPTRSPMIRSTSSTQFRARKPLYMRRFCNFPRCVRLPGSPLRVSGEHTRTIQITTPTVGGLVKFAVKTIYRLACKTPLRANNSGQQCVPLTPLIPNLFTFRVIT